MTNLHVRMGMHDFDFLFGSWEIVNERLRSRLTGSNEWERFEALYDCRPILGGMGNLDEFRPTWPGHEGFQANSLRLFNPATQQWSIYWMDTVRGELFPPVVGGFADGVGEFYGDDQEAGRPVRVRYLWSEITPTSIRWEQAFSGNESETWETNWIMTFSRSQNV